MKKKVHSKPSSPSPQSLDLKTLIDDHSLFFDNLVKLIPAKFYLPGPNDDDKPWFQGLSKAAKASAKKQSREKLKKSRRLRFNPNAPSSTLDLLHSSIDPTETKPEEESQSQSQSLTYEELRQRLHRRIEELRSNRNTRPKNEPRKRKLEDRKSEEEEDENSAAAAVTDVMYGRVKVGDGEDEKRRKKKRLSKVKELERAERLEEMKKDPEKGEIVTKKHSWKAAESRAAGVKVHDDPKLLRESIKKERKRQQKHAEKWKERTESRESMRKEKQKTRTENIRERAQQKKTKRIEKREKKLTRPGFEGRKEGYINQ